MHAIQATRNRAVSGRLPGLVALGLLLPAWAAAAIPGLPGPSFQLTAREGYVLTPDGGSLYSWGYAAAGGSMQYPGPTLIVTQNQTVTVTLRNELPAAAGNVSIVFPGQDVNPIGGVSGLLTREATPGGSVSYSFVARRAGTFSYHSGSRPELQVEMGLVGALIVRPARGAITCPAGEQLAYNHLGTCYDREFLFLLTEMDLDLHKAVEQQVGGAGPIEATTEPYDPEYWFINGRCAPDTMGMPGTELLPHQPYNSMPQMYPGERLLLRVVGAGRQLHPFHHHGNHARVVARDAQPLLSQGALVGPTVFTITSVPGSTTDAIFEWTGKGLGWDIYGHAAGDALAPNEWAADHGKPFPVELPEGQNLTVGGFWSGSPFMGAAGSIPPGEGGLNPNAGYTYMWHSHAEREMVNNDVFPGGMMTMLVVHPPGSTFTE